LKAKKPKRKTTSEIYGVYKMKKNIIHSSEIKPSKLNKIPQKIKSKVKKLKKNTQSFNYTNMSSTNGYPCYPS
jgi:hypothetical protein